MAPPPKRTSSRNSQGPQKRTTTKPEATDVVLEVSDPMDLWYLCEKVAFAQVNPLFRSDGTPMYQRVVTQLVRMDCEFFRYAFPYVGEVGYDMTKSPPEPIMSKKQPHRPSEFPLSQYRAIKQDSLAQIFGPALAVEEVLLSTAELEGMISPDAKSGKPQPLQNVSGLLRIPDVIRVKTIGGGGKAQFSQANIHNVIEIKFEGDRLSEGQAEAYRDIAGDANNFRLLQTKTCDGRKSRTRDWIRSASKEPVYVPVGQAMKMAARRRGGMPFVSEYQLLIDRIDREHEEVRRLITPQPVPVGTPVLKAGPTAEEERQRRNQQERSVRAMEFILNPALPVVAAGAVASGGPIVFGGGAALPAVTARTGAQIIQFPRVLRPLVAGAAAAGATQQLAAAPAPEKPVMLQPLPMAYVYWPD
jgi:hypothetical protein